MAGANEKAFWYAHDRPKPEGAMGPPGRRNPEHGMKWRAVLELVGADRTAAVHEASGGAAAAEFTPRLIGLTLAEGRHMLTAVQRALPT
jgi:hypothetical protein